MSQYNLIDEKWISVRMLDGKHCLFGIAETLLRAKEVASIEDPSPLVVASIHRFLLALLYRAIEGPCDFDEAEELFKNGLPQDKIKNYLKQWHDRFWLFDEKYPFGQIPYYEPKEWKSWTTLTAEHNAYNTKVLFDHVNVKSSGSISTGKAICALLATQTFALGGGKSDFNNRRNAPSATAVMVLPIGYNLEETLIFSLISQNRETLKRDLPIWEREPESVDELKEDRKRDIDGFVDLYTWRTCTIRLQRNTGAGIEKVGFASGVGHNNTDIQDPMLAYRRDKNKGLLPIQFKEKGLWRDFDSLLPDNSGLAPKVIEHSFHLARRNHKRLPQSVMVFGQSNDQAKVKYWRMERFTLPEALISENSISSEIRNLLMIAEEAQKILWKACHEFASCLLSRGGSKQSKENINSFVNQMICIPLYWSAMEAEFHSVLGSYSLNKDPDEIKKNWKSAIRATINDAWRQQKSSLSLSDSWEIRALVKAEGYLFGMLSKQFKNN